MDKIIETLSKLRKVMSHKTQNKIIFVEKYCVAKLSKSCLNLE